MQTNPPISTLLRYFSIIEILVLIFAGVGLFLLPDAMHDIWGWELTPFNTRFLGAIYWAAMLPILQMVALARWSPTRPVLRMIFIFTFIVLLVSLAYTGKFMFDRGIAWFWFVLYISLPINAGYHLWLYRSMPTDHLKSVPQQWTLFLGLCGAVMVAYGTGLLVLPATFSKLFPWTLDNFHSQLYSATFFTGGIGVFTIMKRSTPAEWVSVGVTLAMFGLLVLVGLFVVDADVDVIDWSALDTRLWVAMFVGSFALGGIILARSRQVISHE